MGIMAASSYTFIFLLSVYPFRKRYYEVFFALHVVLSGQVHIICDPLLRVYSVSFVLRTGVIAIYFHVNQSTRYYYFLRLTTTY